MYRARQRRYPAAQVATPGQADQGALRLAPGRKVFRQHCRAQVLAGKMVQSINAVHFETSLPQYLRLLTLWADKPRKLGAMPIANPVPVLKIGGMLGGRSHRGEIVDLFSVTECRNFFKAAGYEAQ